MAEMITFEVEKRDVKGKEKSRKLRSKGYIPAVYYDFKGENILLQVRKSAFLKSWQEAGSTKVVELTIINGEGEEKKPSLIWMVEKHPVKNMVLHVDFYGVNLEKEVDLMVPIKVVGKAKGIEKGGVLEIFREELEVKCLPLHIPEVIEIDVTDLDLNQNLHIDEIKMPEGVKAVFEENFAVVGVVEPETEESEEEESEEEE